MDCAATLDVETRVNAIKHNPVNPTKPLVLDFKASLLNELRFPIEWGVSERKCNGTAHFQWLGDGA
jgi:hypothetical protein